MVSLKKSLMSEKAYTAILPENVNVYVSSDVIL